MISLTADRTLLCQTWSRFWYIHIIRSTWQRKRPATLHDGACKQTSWQLHHTCIWSWYQTCDPLLDLEMSALLQSPTLSWILNWRGGGVWLRAVVFAHLGHLLRAAADKHLRMLIVGEQPRISNSFKSSFTFPIRPCSL